MTYYVYAPTTGQSLVEPDSSRCDIGGTHKGACGFSDDPAISKPFDLAYVTDLTCRLYTSSNILSVKTTRLDNCACGGCDAVNDAIRVDLYRGYNATLWVGAVLFAHLTANSRYPNATINYPNYSGIQLGIIAADNCAQDCYVGEHVHMATQAGILNPATNYQVYFYASGSWVYRYVAV